MGKELAKGVRWSDTSRPGKGSNHVVVNICLHASVIRVSSQSLMHDALARVFLVALAGVCAARGGVGGIVEGLGGVMKSQLSVLGLRR